MRILYKMEKVAIIGSNSFSGSHCVNHLLENTNYKVIGISRSHEPQDILLPYKGKEQGRFRFFRYDLNKDLDEIINLFNKEQINYVINFAAQGMVGQSWDNPLHWYRTNILGTVALVEALKQLTSLKKYVHISSPEIYGPSDNLTENNAQINPSTPYANSKATADTHIKLISKQFGFPAVFVRSTNVYGPAQQLYRIIPIAIIKIKKGEKIQLHGGGRAVKSYIHIRDICNGYLKILEQGRIGEAYHLSPDRGYSIRELVELICNKLNTPFEEAVEIVDERPGQDAQYIINSQKARAELNWQPKITIEQGIDECIEWVNQNWEIIKDLPLNYIHKE